MKLHEFRVSGPANLELARQSARERADALGIEVRVLDETGALVDTARPRKPIRSAKRVTA